MSQKKPTNYSALYALVGVFFFWGFIAASNGVFIPFAKSKFELSQFQSQLIDSAFYFAYYIGAFLLFIFSIIGKKDLLNNWGFKNGIVYGLMISVSGAFLMFPALASNSFAFILAALFIIGLGFSLQQTAAQPFAIALGGLFLPVFFWLAFWNVPVGAIHHCSLRVGNAGCVFPEIRKKNKIDACNSGGVLFWHRSFR